MHTLTTRSHSFIPASDTSHVEQSSPINSNSVNTLNQNSGNIQAFSVFANVNIPEKNGSKWISSTAHSSCHQTINTTFPIAPVPPARTDLHLSEANGCEEAPLLPKKPNTFSPTFGDGTTGTNSRLDSTWNVSDDCIGLQQQAAQMSSNIPVYNNQTGTGSDNEPLPSPLPRVVVSPRHEMHSISNRSPFQFTATFNKSNYGSSNHYR